MKREAQFQVRFSHWLKAVYLKNNHGGLFELKQCKLSLPFDAVAVHQLDALVCAKLGKFYYKIPDDSVGQKPVDCVGLSCVDAYIVIYYSHERFFCLVDVLVFVAEEKDSDRRSLTAARAREISEIVVEC
mgnify:CR=1 FL=1